jgi:hypothetical protein
VEQPASSVGPHSPRRPFAPSATPPAQAGSCGRRASPVTLSFARRTFGSVATAQLFSSREDCRARPRSRRHAPESGGGWRVPDPGSQGSRPRDRLQVEARGRSASSPLPSGARRTSRSTLGPPGLLAAASMVSTGRARVDTIVDTIPAARDPPPEGDLRPLGWSPIACQRGIYGAGWYLFGIYSSAHPARRIS